MSKPQLGEQAHSQEACIDIIKDALHEMGQQWRDQFDFCYSNGRPLKGRIRRMIRTVYLRFDCPKCKRQEQEGSSKRQFGRQRRWTSTYGAAEIKFCFRDLTEEDLDRRILQSIKYKKLLIFKFRIYGMRCNQCRRFGYPEIYDSNINFMSNRFCQIVADILNKVKKKRRVKPAKTPFLIDHDIRNCQACALNRHPKHIMQQLQEMKKQARIGSSRTEQSGSDTD